MVEILESRQLLAAESLSIAGNVYLNNANNTETPVGGVTVILSAVSPGGTVTQIASTTTSTGTTGPVGSYSFTGLNSGQYLITEQTPNGYVYISDVLGTGYGSFTGGSAGNDQIETPSVRLSVLTGNINSINNNFFLGLHTPTIVSAASPPITLGDSAPTLSDTVVVANGYNETGNLVFTLSGPGGYSSTQNVPLDGNGTYSASDILPIAGTVAGQYTWKVTYAGDSFNYGAQDQGGTAEQTTVSKANPQINTKASPPETLGTTAPILSDTAVVTNGYYETGSLVFTLSGPGGYSYSQNVAVNGNGTYSASDTLPVTGAVAGTYTWSVTYAGDSNNNSAQDEGGTAEQTVLSNANPSIYTTASPAVTLSTSAPTLTDTAVVTNGYFETGNLVFTLSGPDGYTYSQTVAISGNGTYSASDTLPTLGAVAGTYTWSVSYAGDGNNNRAQDEGGTTEQTIVSMASPTIITTAKEDGTTLSDTAVVSNGYFETGSLIFTLSGPDGFSYSQTVPLTGAGNGIYTASDTLPISGQVAGNYTWSVTYAGDSNNNGAVDQGGTTEQSSVSMASPTIVTTASPAISLGTTAPVLSDTAVVTNGYYETGNLVFTLSGPGGFSYTQQVALDGNGTYSASDILPITGAVAGAYTWSVTYAGDGNNNGAVDEGGSAEQTVVSNASPSIYTTASSAVTLGTAAPTLSDTAVVTNGYYETGTLVFTLSGPNGYSYTQNVAISGNNTYTASDTLPMTGTVAGTYTWSVSYIGDSNNNGAVDESGPTEQTVVSKASPVINTTASPAVTLGTAAPTLSDTAVVTNGYFETGNLVFTLSGPNGFSYTQDVAVSGNGTYTASDILPTMGAVAGTYTWSVTYAGDSNNNRAVDEGGTLEQTVVSNASPAINTTASSAISLGAIAPTLSDTAVVTNGYFETGNLVFTLSGPNGFTYTQDVAVSGNGTYTASDILPTIGAVAGTYTWSVTYAGDSNNNNAVDEGGTPEQTVVSNATPVINTTASSAVTLAGTTAPTLSDTAVVTNGYYESGNLVFTLSGPNGFNYTQNVPVSGNGTYTASDTLPMTGAVAGTYTWSVTYAGDSNNNNAVDEGGTLEQTVVSKASPSIYTTASSAVTLVGPTAPTLSDTAVVTNGYYESGNLVFTLSGPNGFSYTQNVPVSGDGTYTASDTLPMTGAVAGTYTWSVTYAADSNNNSAVDEGGSAEQTVVSKASPSIYTTASSAVTLSGNTAPTLSDTAVVTNGYYESGNLVFTLSGPNGFSYTQNVPVSGNGTYTASDILPMTGAIAGTYTWSVTYAGDNNNKSAVDEGGTTEQTTVKAAAPTIVTAASPTVTLGTTAPTISDTAVVTGGYNETGNLVFTLSGPNGFSYTKNVPITGNGTYTVSDTLPMTGTVVGTYTWNVTYAGDGNNNSAKDQSGTAEQTIVKAASPTIVTSASASSTTCSSSTTLSDTAVFANGYYETGNLVFTLSGPNGFSYTKNVPLNVNGNGTYTVSDTLPTSGVTAGTYSWVVTYAGDNNNNSAKDQGGTAEQIVLKTATPTIVTAASPTVTLGTTAPTISDTAVVTGGYNETGNLVFTLSGPGGFSYTKNVPINGNGTYSASDILPITGTTAGTYTWNVTYAGDGNNSSAKDQGGTAEQTIVKAASPTIVTCASSSSTTCSSSTTLSDTAVFANGYYETGNLVFTLSGPNGFSYTKNVAVNGNGTYSASDTLPTSGVTAGTYTWVVTYAGDSDNNSAKDQGGSAEQIVVKTASPTIVTAASPTVTLGTTAPTISDTAVVTGGYNETGYLVFTLSGPNGFSYTKNVAINGNGTYSASDILPITGTTAGTYTWNVTYAGDGNNSSAKDQGGTAEQTIVKAASPTIVTCASSSSTTCSSSTTLSDTAVFANGYYETGNLVFTLSGPNGFSYTKNVPVNGNGTYSASDTLPTSGVAAGTYTWVVTYAGDSDNNSAKDQGGSAEQIVVKTATPTIVTAASQAVTLGTTAPTISDTAVVTGGYNETGYLVFTLSGPNGFSYTKNVAINGNGTYSASDTLPITGTTVGTYTWNVTYAGDSNNSSAKDQGGCAEQTTVSQASPCVVTNASLSGTTISDTAVISGGYYETGNLVFTLSGPCGVSYTKTVAVNGNGTYSASDTLTSSQLVVGTYTWSVSYSGDSDNKCANDQGQAAEKLVIGGLSGTVYVDKNCNDVFNSSVDSGLGGVTVTLTGTNVEGQPITMTTTTASNGTYNFVGLLAGTYTVTETHPAGYKDETSNPGSTGGTAGIDTISNISLPAGATSVNNNFGELTGTLSGTVYVDNNCNDAYNTNVDSGLGGVTVKLTGTNALGQTVSMTTTTASNGTYSFTGLLSGTYTITEVHPTGYKDESPNPGSTGGTSSYTQGVSEVISNIAFAAGATSINNNFGELSTSQSGCGGSSGCGSGSGGDCGSGGGSGCGSGSGYGGGGCY